MTLVQNRFWHIQSGTSEKQLLDKLAENFKVEKDSPSTISVCILDDPDAAVSAAGKLLVKAGRNQWWLYHDEGIDKVSRVSAKARFWWDLPDSALKSNLKELIDLRAVIPVGDINVSEQAFVTRNEDEKIVLRGNLTVVCRADQPSSNCLFVELRSLRGYDKAFERTIELLQGLLADELDAVSMQAMVQHCGIGPEVAETKPGFGIYGEEPVELAVRQMSLQMLRIAKGNQQGVVDDIDTEFLHQYRVSLRKSRSLINLMKKAFPADIHQRLKTLLGDLAGCTNQLRDLDVFLLGRESYAQMLPENFQAGFDQLFRMIAQDREKARKSVGKVFQSTDHANTFREVFEILEQEPLYENAFASQPVLEAASKKIIRRYQRIVAMGVKMDDKTPDEEIHELRIECKKLRYMMEFFAELFPKKAIKGLIKTLKKLQTILGDFNDYSVQKEFLADYEKKHKRSVELSAAINGLIAVLHQKQLHERTWVQQAFADFNQDAVREKFSELFSSQNQPEAGK